VLRVNEIFYSMQGESGYAGWPCVFVRLSGCNLRCTYCDTLYAYEEGSSMEIGEIVDRIRPFECPLVEVTGGEPLIQTEAPALVERLLESGYRVLVETNGSQDISRLDPRCVRIVDFKCPSSGEADSNDLDNIARLRDRDEVKMVIGTREDFDFAKEILARIRRSAEHREVAVLFSPVFGELTPRSLAEWILADRLQVRLNLQLHKIIWGPERRGV